MRRAAAVLIAGAAVALGPILVPAPASADVTGSTSSDDVVLYPSCQRHDVTYDIDVSPGTSFWNLEIQVESPTGFQSQGVVLTSNGSPTSGTVNAGIFCGSEPPGTWTVHGTGIYEFVPGMRISYALPDSTFQVRRAQTRSVLTTKKLSHHNVRLISTITDERRDGFDPTEGATVDVERLVDGSWRKVKRSRERSVHGHTTTTVRATRGVTYRAVTYGRGNYTGSTSAPIKLR